MATHLENLIKNIPDILKRPSLDIGSGRGGFLLDFARHGGSIIGLEKNDEYIKYTNNSAAQAGLRISVKSGEAEKLPFNNGEFLFINMSEVIEHIEDPNMVISEAYRVLKKNGIVYMSAPNRFSLRDPHFHLYFVNWLPRFLSDIFLSVFGKHKDYSDNNAGRQRLKDMHYYTSLDIMKICKKNGFDVVDIRENKIKNIIKNNLLSWLAIKVYKIARFFYYDSFHLLLTKL